MTPEDWRRGEIAVIGLGRSGDAVSRLLRAHHARVYASDAGAAPSIAKVAEGLRAVGVETDTGNHDLARVARAAEDGTVMALRHRRHPLHGVQFHPESVLTSNGRTLLRAFLDMEA